jgi:predicted nucleotidyltransferase
MTPMELSEVLDIIAANEDELRRRHVATLSVFGSVARGEARPDSDVDLLVEFDKPVSLFVMFRLQRYLEELIGRPVQLVEREAVLEPLRDRIFGEAIRAA